MSSVSHVTRDMCHERASVATLVVIIVTRMDYLHSWIYRELSLTLDSLVTHSTRIAIEVKNKQKQILMSQHWEICLQPSSDWCKTDSNWLSESPQNKIFYWCFSQLYVYFPGNRRGWHRVTLAHCRGLINGKCHPSSCQNLLNWYKCRGWEHHTHLLPIIIIYFPRNK